MCGVVGSAIVLLLGGIFIVICSTVGYILVPDIIKNLIVDSVVLAEDTIQFDRFEEVPFPLDVSIYLFNITNVDEVLNGEIPVVSEVGPYKYKLYITRNITSIDRDILTYSRTEYLEFDGEASYPLTEDDMTTVINVPYHAISQIAERDFAQLLPLLSMAMGGVFGDNNSPIMVTRVRDLLLDGVPLCLNPGLLGAVACNLIRSIAVGAKNIILKENGSMVFSVFGYKQGIPTPEYEVYRGLEDYNNLGHIRKFDNLPYLRYWINQSDIEEQRDFIPNQCSMINGTDSGIFAPFFDTNESIYVLNPDICRSVELRYQNNTDVKGIPTVRYTVKEWFLDNDEGCFCLNVTKGINREDGCLLRGAMELYTCIDMLSCCMANLTYFIRRKQGKQAFCSLCCSNSFLDMDILGCCVLLLLIVYNSTSISGYIVLTYPHFLYADMKYRNGVFGLSPEEDNHRIFMDFEPRTGTPIQGAKRAQFNIFSRPVSGLPMTDNLRTTLVPILWVEENFLMPDELLDEIRSSLIRPLNLLRILIPVTIAVSGVIMLTGIILTIIEQRKKKNDN